MATVVVRTTRCVTCVMLVLPATSGTGGRCNCSESLSRELLMPSTLRVDNDCLLNVKPIVFVVFLTAVRAYLLCSQMQGLERRGIPTVGGPLGVALRRRVSQCGAATRDARLLLPRRGGGQQLHRWQPLGGADYLFSCPCSLGEPAS